MDFADEVARESQVPPATRRIDWIIERMGDEGPDVLVALRDPEIPPIAIAKVLIDRGFDISPQAISARCRKERK